MRYFIALLTLLLLSSAAYSQTKIEWRHLGRSVKDSIPDLPIKPADIDLDDIEDTLTFRMADTFIVAASNSELDWQDNAKLVLDGTDDHVQINSIIALRDSQVVMFAPGAYTIGSAITDQGKDYIVLAGSGPGVDFRAKDSLNGDMMKIDSCTYFEMRNIYMNGNDAMQSSGNGLLTQNVDIVVIDNVHIDSTYDHAMSLQSVQYASVNNYRSKHSTQGRGIDIDWNVGGADDESKNVNISNVWIEDHGASGIKVENTFGVNITNAQIYEDSPKSGSTSALKFGHNDAASDTTQDITVSNSNIYGKISIDKTSGPITFSNVNVIDGFLAIEDTNGVITFTGGQIHSEFGVDNRLVDTNTDAKGVVHISNIVGTGDGTVNKAFEIGGDVLFSLHDSYISGFTGTGVELGTSADTCVIAGNRFVGGDGNGATEIGVKSSGRRTVIMNNQFFNFRHGIRTEAGDNAFIANNLLYGKASAAADTAINFVGGDSHWAINNTVLNYNGASDVEIFDGAGSDAPLWRGNVGGNTALWRRSLFEDTLQVYSSFGAGGLKLYYTSNDSAYIKAASDIHIVNDDTIHFDDNLQYFEATTTAVLRAGGVMQIRANADDNDYLEISSDGSNITINVIGANNIFFGDNLVPSTDGDKYMGNVSNQWGGAYWERHAADPGDDTRNVRWLDGGVNADTLMFGNGGYILFDVSE